MSSGPMSSGPMSSGPMSSGPMSSGPMTGGPMTGGWGYDSGQRVSNPPGLDQIAYRVATFAGFRRALLTPLAGEQQLVGWSPGPGDLGLQILEWWAYLADILTFYNERIANGSYLRTAAAQPGPQHAAGLVRLLGYVTAPAITATGSVAVIRGAGARDGKLKIPAGMQITSTPTAGVPAQLFEVTGDHAFSGPSDAPVSLPADPALFRPVAARADRTGPDEAGPDKASANKGSDDPAAAPRTVLLSGQVAVAPGDQFILISGDWDGTTGEWAVVTAGPSVAEQDPGGGVNTRLTLTSGDWHALAVGPRAEPGLGPPAEPAAGPPLARGYRLQRAPATALLWTMGGGVGTQLARVGSPAAETGPQTLTVSMATLVRNVTPGDVVVFTGATGGTSPRAIALAGYVTGYAEQVTRVPARSGQPLTGPGRDVYITHTDLTIRTAGAGADVAALRSALGTPALGGVAMHYGLRDIGEVIPTPSASLASLPVTVGLPPALTPPAGPVALQDADGNGLMVIAAAGAPGSVTLAPADGRSGPLHPALRSPIRLLADLVAVSRGATVRSEVLGDGDPTAASQAFTLRQSPLVYLPPAEPGGDPVSTLSVRVDQVPWTEVRAFAGHRQDATVYMVSRLPGGSVQVRFGDGINGARLPLGVGNVTATYRYGPSVPSPPAGALTTILQPQPNLGAVVNPLAILPGTNPETAAQTAEAAPAAALLLPGVTSVIAPLISRADSERLAATVSGVTRVRAYRTWDRQLRCPALTVYVSSDHDTSAAVAAVGRLFPGGAGYARLHVAPAHGVDLAVRGQLLCSRSLSEDDVVKAATEALTGADGLFSPRRTGIGHRLYRSQVEAALMVAGVTAVLGLHVRFPERDDGPQASVLDPGQDGYLRLRAQELSISVIHR
jgi:hypothetical protein